MRTLPDVLRGEPPTLGPSQQETHTWLVEAITPVLGGGVDSFEPDPHDVVRVPSVRGALRWWWRALHPGLTIDELRTRERELWGGVGATPKDTRASAVRVRVDVQNPGRVVPAGEHEMRGGRLAVLPRWLGGRELGYGLFPLQRTASERNAWTRSSAMPTKNLREGLTFSLSVSVDPSKYAEVLEAVTAWLVFGGYGARTRRGFGALSSPKVTLAEGARVLASRQSVDGDKERPTKERLIKERPTVGGCALYQSKTVHRSAEDAHRALLGALMYFRQSPGFARNPGHERPGRSRWPEPDTLRNEAGRYRYKHMPNNAAKAAPRAAFGLPIVVTFKDREDSPANAMLVPAEGGRWASPVILRPVKVEGGYRAVVLRLTGHLPQNVLAHGNKIPVASSAGASGEIQRLLDDTRRGGSSEVDATVTFTQWLCDAREFEAVAR